MKKWIMVMISVLVIGIGGYMWFSSKTSAQQVPTQIRTASVQKGTLTVKVSGSGTVQPVTSEDIKSTIDNNSISEVNVTAGQAVSKGTELVTFTDGSTPITAPTDGVVTSVSVVAGQRVTNGEVVAHLTNYNDLQTVVSIDELDIAKIQVGQAVNISVNSFPDQTFTGKVTAISNEGTSTNGVSTFDVTVHIDKSTGLKVGMSTEASIVTQNKANALYVPIEAVHETNNQKYVLVTTASAENQTSKTQKQIVQTGLANEDNVEITQGLTQGETVQLPKLATGTASVSTSNKSNSFMQAGFGGIGGYSGMRSSGGNGYSRRSGN